MSLINSTTYEQVASDIELLAKNKCWKELRTYFTFWKDDEELFCKVIAWGRFFLGHYLRDDTPDFHFALVAENFSKKNEYTAAPRGFAKTTINQLCIAYQCAHKLEKFIVVVEKSFNEAAEVIRGVADEFKDNPMILQVYGHLVKMSDSGDFDDKNKDAQGDIMINGVRVRAKGFNTPIRGLKSKEWRPTKIYLDDVESDEHINSDDQRKKYRENYSQGIVPSIDIGGSIKVRGTILHNDSLLKNLIDQFKGKIYKAFDENNPEQTLLWPQRWTYARLMEKKDEMEMEGKGASKFFQEYLNEPLDNENRAFKFEWLQKTYTDEDLKMRAIARYITIDVAESKKDGSDFTGVSVVDWDQENNWFLQHIKRHKVNITGLIDLIFELWQFWKPIKIGVEKKAFEDQIKPLLRIKSEETGIFPIVVELEHGGNRKEDRIRGALVGRFESGKIWFRKDAKDDQLVLKGELYDFPNAKNDDLSDSLAYIQSLGNRPMGRSKEQKSQVEIEFENYKRRQMKRGIDKL